MCSGDAGCADGRAQGVRHLIYRDCTCGHHNMGILVLLLCLAWGGAVRLLLTEPLTRLVEPSQGLVFLLSIRAAAATVAVTGLLFWATVGVSRLVLFALCGMFVYLTKVLFEHNNIGV